MLERVVEKWRRVDRWPEAEATVTSYQVISDGGYKEGLPTARIAFYYCDSSNDLQSGELVVDSMTSLYNLRVSDTFPIRFDPEKPSKFYSSESSSTFTGFVYMFWIGLAVVLLIIASIALFKRI